MKLKSKSFKVFILLIFFFNSIYAQLNDYQYINSDSLRLTRAYSHAVLIEPSGLVKTSGIIGTDKNGSLINTTPRQQIARTFYNIEKILEASGAQVNDIIEIQTFLTDSIYFRDYVLERTNFFKNRTQPPISKTYYIKGLINPQAIVEINVSAFLDRKRDVESYYYVNAIITAKPGKLNELQEELAKLVEPTRREKGCYQYDLFKVKEKNAFVLNETWIDEHAFHRHFEMPYLKKFSNTSKDLVEKIEIYTMEKLN